MEGREEQGVRWVKEEEDKQNIPWYVVPVCLSIENIYPPCDVEQSMWARVFLLQHDPGIALLQPLLHLPTLTALQELLEGTNCNTGMHVCVLGGRRG